MHRASMERIAATFISHNLCHPWMASSAPRWCTHIMLITTKFLGPSTTHRQVRTRSSIYSVQRTSKPVHSSLNKKWLIRSERKAHDWSNTSCETATYRPVNSGSKPALNIHEVTPTWAALNIVTIIPNQSTHSSKRSSRVRCQRPRGDLPWTTRRTIWALPSRWTWLISTTRVWALTAEHSMRTMCPRVGRHLESWAPTARSETAVPWWIRRSRDSRQTTRTSWSRWSRRFIHQRTLIRLTDCRLEGPSRHETSPSHEAPLKCKLHENIPNHETRTTPRSVVRRTCHNWSPLHEMCENLVRVRTVVKPHVALYQQHVWCTPRIRNNDTPCRIHSSIHWYSHPPPRTTTGYLANLRRLSGIISKLISRQERNCT